MLGYGRQGEIGNEGLIRSTRILFVFEAAIYQATCDQ